jgi:hypothetical protein
MLEEEELVQIKQDYVIEFDELIGYESLIRAMQKMDIPRFEIFLY